MTSPQVASLMRRALDRRASAARARFRLERGRLGCVLAARVGRDGSAYDELVNVVRDWPLTDENLEVLLADAAECVVLLGREVQALAEVVCNVDWCDRSERLIELYSRFCLDLVTAHNYHCPVVLTSLLKQFKGEGKMWNEEPPTEMVTKWSNAHSIIAQIVAVMPMSSDLLLQCIVEQFPYYKAGSYINRTYIHNLIWITKYIPSLLEQIMTVIITRMIVMDVNTSDKMKQKIKCEEMFAMDMDNVDDEVEDSLDYCMLEMLQWLQHERNQALNTMCSVFERVILPTHGTRHIQFLLLYTISISQQCADRVLSNLWTVAAGMHTLGPGAIATRRTAAAHLAGLLARCVRLPNTRLINYLKNMSDWCHDYIKATQESTSAPSDSVKVHGAFYAVCHAVFYLVAFKHQHLFVSKESIHFVESLNLPRLITCSLNPLRTCPPQVTRAFASVTRAHQVVYCQAVIDKNSRHTLHARVEAEYDDWFPYDPYTLARSGKLVWPLCIEYKEWLNENEDDTQYVSRVKKLEADDEDYFMNTPSFKLASSLSNCVSPGFKYM